MEGGKEKKERVGGGGLWPLQKEEKPPTQRAGVLEGYLSYIKILYIYLIFYYKDAQRAPITPRTQNNTTFTLRKTVNKRGDETIYL